MKFDCALHWIKFCFWFYCIAVFDFCKKKLKLKIEGWFFEMEPEFWPSLDTNFMSGIFKQLGCATNFLFYI